MKQGLRATIIPMLEATTTARLTGMSGVNLDHLETSCVSFVFEKRVQLGKTPTMQSALVLNILVLFASSHLGGFSKVLEIFQGDGCACGGVLYDPFGEDVIMVFASPKLFSRELTQVAFCAPGAFGLQFPFDAKGAPVLFFPPTFSQELASAGDSGAIESQVHTNHLVRGFDASSWDGHHNMQSIATLAVAQIGATRLVTNVLLQVIRNREGQFNTPIDSRQVTRVRVPLDPIGALIIANADQITLRAVNRLKGRNGFSLSLGFCHLLGVRLFMFLFPRERTFDALCGSHTSSTDQLSRQVGILRTKGIVRAFMQLHSIAASGREPNTCNGIVTSGMLLKRHPERESLLRCGIELYYNRSIHTKSISYIRLICQKSRGYPPLPQRRNASFLPDLKIRGFQKRRVYEDEDLYSLPPP